MRTLVVQQGHVDRRTGATGTSGEQDFARAAADAIRAEVHARPNHDWVVRIIHADEASSRYAGSAFVAIHCDGSTSSTARGASVGYQNTAGRDLGRAWTAAYQANGWTGGFRSPNYTPSLASYYGVRKAIQQGNTAAVILEAGFLTNRSGKAPTDRALLTAADGPRRLARAVADALGLLTAPPPSEPTTRRPPLMIVYTNGSKARLCEASGHRIDVSNPDRLAELKSKGVPVIALSIAEWNARMGEDA